MIIFCLTVIVLIVSIITCILTRISLDRRIKEGQKMIVAHNFMWLLGIGSATLFLIISTIGFVQDGMVLTTNLMLGFVWFSLLLVYGWFGMITFYDDDGFTKGWLPLQKKRYTYAQLTGGKITLKGYKLYINKKCISYEDGIIDCNPFYRYALKQHKNITGKNLKEEKTNPKWDVFNGHLENPEEFIIIIIIFLVIGFGMIGWSIYELHDYKTKEDLTRIKVVIDDSYTDDNHLILESRIPGCKFDIKFLDDLDKEVGQILNEVSKNKPIYVYAKGYKEKNKTKGKYDVYCVETVKGEEIISLEKMNELNKEVAVSGFPIAVVLSVVSICFSMVILLVGRYPHKFSKRIRKAIFQDGYLH